VAANIILFVLLASSSSSWAKSNCVSKELRLMSCEIQFKGATYRLRKESMRINDGTWRGVFYWPNSEAAVEWHTMKFRELGGRRLLVAKIWRQEPSVPALDLESLHWVVYEVSGTKVEQRFDKIIQKRRRGAGTKEQPPGKYLSGKLESHLLVKENEEVFWKLGHTKGKLVSEEARAEVGAAVEKMEAAE